jgi:glycosyltransferase domain-containing protein
MNELNLENHGLSKLTVVIPTISRPEFVKRQIIFWSQFDAQVRILDGAKTPIDTSQLGLLPKNIQYLHEPQRFNERLSNAWKHVDTEFACLLPDDEFFLPSGLASSMRYLDQNPNITGCVGKVLMFFVDQGRFLTYQDYEYWRNFATDSVTAESRVQEVLPPNKVHKVQFAVLRSSIWKEIFTSSYCDFYSTGYLYERMLNLHSAVLGRTVVLDELMWMRSMENPPLTNAAVPRDDGGMLGWADNPSNRDEVLHYVKKVERIIGSEGSIEASKALKFAEQFVYGGFETHRIKVQNSKHSFRRRLSEVLIHYAPKSIKLAAKRIGPRKLLGYLDWQGFVLEETCNKLEQSGIAFNKRELQLIERLALEMDLERRTAGYKSIPAHLVQR